MTRLKSELHYSMDLSPLRADRSRSVGVGAVRSKIHSASKALLPKRKILFRPLYSRRLPKKLSAGILTKALLDDIFNVWDLH